MKANHTSNRIAHILFGALTLTVLMPTLLLADTLRTVILSGDGAPGTAETFLDFGAPIINSDGNTSFFAELDDFDGTSGLWSEGSGSLQNATLQGEVAPDTGGLLFDTFGGRHYLNNTGQTAFNQTFDSFQTNGAFSETGAGNALRKIAAGGDSAPGTTDPTRVFQPFFGDLGGFNDSGQSAFRASMPPTAAPPGNFPSSGVWSEGSGTLAKIAEVGDAAPNTAGNFSEFAIPTINNNGHVAFVAEANAGSGQGVWTNRSGALARLAGAGEAAPGGGTFSILFNSVVAMNNTGDVGFSAKLVGGAVPDGIWVARNATIEKVAVEGDVAPDSGGATFGTGAQGIDVATIGLDASGNAAFRATLSDNRLGLWSEGLGGLHAVAITGDTAPDSGGATFDSIVHWSINDLGQTALLAGVSDFTEAIFAEDIFGSLLRIVGPGDVLEVAPADFREVEFVNFFGLDGSIGENGNNFSHGFNADGELSYWASFTDGSTGVFVTTVPIPEPASVVLLAIGGLCAAWALKRRR